MATPYRQPIWPGDIGSDVRAVKRGMQKMGAHGAGGLIVSGDAGKRAGESFVEVLNGILRRHNRRTDGKYGPEAHEIIAPHFDLWGIQLYKKAAIRPHQPPAPPVWAMDARQAAAQLLELRVTGRYRADNRGDLSDLQATANGKAVWSQRGLWVHIDPRPLRLLVWIIKVHNYRLGTFALCSDHHDDGPHGHAGGLAVDISSINDHSISGGGAHDLTKAVASLCRSAPSRPRQLICAGSGYVFYSDIEALCIPGPWYYPADLSGHRNHIHAGY